MDTLLFTLTMFTAVLISGLVISDMEEQREERDNKLIEKLNKLKKQIKREQIERKKERDYRDRALALEIVEKNAQIAIKMERFRIKMSLPANTSPESSSAPQDSGDVIF